MTPAQWDTTTALLHRCDKQTGAVLKASGRVLAFDGFYRATGVPTDGDEQLLPAITEQQELAPFSIEPEQLFSSPPPRYSEASLVKGLEKNGIGRPSTYASIIEVIQERRYVEQLERRFHATDLGEVVSDKLVEGFPRLMDVSYTGRMEDDTPTAARMTALTRPVAPVSRVPSCPRKSFQDNGMEARQENVPSQNTGL